MLSAIILYYKFVCPKTIFRNSAVDRDPLPCRDFGYDNHRVELRCEVVIMIIYTGVLEMRITLAGKTSDSEGVNLENLALFFVQGDKHVHQCRNGTKFSVIIYMFTSAVHSNMVER